MNVQQLITHGKYGTPVYVTWWSMKQRCLNPKRKDYVRYGGRGIGVGKTKVTDRRGLRVPLGSAHGQAKLKEADIPEIRKLLTALSQAEVANLYSVSRSTIEGIHRGVTWKSVA